MPDVRTIPAHTSFVDSLVAGLLTRSGQPLADMLVLLPSRRACIAVRDAFLRLSNGEPMLLPRLQPIGEALTEEVLFDPSAALELPPAITPIERLTTLTRLVAAQGMTFEQAVRLAAELAALLDELAIEDVPLERIRHVVPTQFAEHWQESLKFLEIIGSAWPALLAARGALDPAAHRNRLLAAVTQRFKQRPPAGPVIAAGMIGSIPAVARLLHVIARLDQGCVVLPGLDLAMDEEDWHLLGPAHPQYGLKRLLDVMEVERVQVTRWQAEAAASGQPQAASSRFDLWRQTMRPAETSEAWAVPGLIAKSALAGIEFATHPDLSSEATDLALRIREALETPGKTVALVTTDRNLARRVAAELSRWQILADDSAGIPLDQSPPGTFLLLAAHMVVEQAAPVRLLSLLKHPLAAGGRPRGELRRVARALERGFLRGPRPPMGLQGLRELLAARQNDEHWKAPLPPEELDAFLSGLIAKARPLQDLIDKGEASFAQLLETHLVFVESLAADEEGRPDELWAREAGQALHGFITALREAAGNLGDIATSAYPAVLAVLMGQQSVRPQRPSHPRVAILGQLESRLNLADLVLIGGLNEGVWPRATDTGPWLNRDMRKQLGLPPAEQAIGIAAHDFVMNAMAPHIVLSRARKDQSGAPTLPSRWLSRLTAVLRANDLMADVMPEPARAVWVAALDKPALPIWPQPISRPRPNPPAAARPRSYWATHLQELVSDPYRHYARRILKLRELEPLDADPGPMERGQIIHAAIEEFLLRYPSGPLPEDACDVLLAIGQKVFDIYRNEPRIAVVWWPRFRQIAAWFVDMEGQRRRDVARVLTEIEGELRLAASPGSAAEIRIRARADRIEIGKDGTLNIGDYKTGALPSATDVRSGAAPQLPIEAAIALAGGFDGVNTTKLASLSLWGLRGGDPAGLLMDPTLKRDKAELSAEELARRAREWLERLAHYLEDPATTYDAVPKPAIARRDDGYEHLSRVAEWYGSDTAPASPDGRSDR